MSAANLGVTLAVLRLIRGWSQAELATEAGVTNSAISDYERGKVDPQTHTLQRLLRALGLPMAAVDDTQGFILGMRARMDVSGVDSGESGISSPAGGGAPAERQLRNEIASATSDLGRAVSHASQLMLELLARRAVERKEMASPSVDAAARGASKEEQGE